MRNVMIRVIAFVSFFVRFFVFELLSILYFTVVNSDLEIAWRGFAKYADDANLFQLGSSKKIILEIFFSI